MADLVNFSTFNVPGGASLLVDNKTVATIGSSSSTILQPAVTLPDSEGTTAPKEVEVTSINGIGWYVWNNTSADRPYAAPIADPSAGKPAGAFPAAAENVLVVTDIDGTLTISVNPV